MGSFIETEKACIAAQRNYCEQHNAPHFAPFDGVCYVCSQHIYQPGGYTLQYATDRLITGCPFCGYSYCD